MKIIIGILLISCFLGRTTAQNANYKRAEETKAFSLPWKYDRLTPFFTEGSDDFWYSLQTNDGEKYFYVDLKNKKVEEFIDPRDDYWNDHRLRWRILPRNPRRSD